eukprot:scaffold101554_cov62-Phaeocystis_antarctica.AAC.5
MSSSSAATVVAVPKAVPLKRPKRVTPRAALATPENFARPFDCPPAYPPPTPDQRPPKFLPGGLAGLPVESLR